MSTTPPRRRSALSKILKLIPLLGIVALVIYQLKLAPTAVRSYEIQPIEIRAEVMGTGTLEARTKVSISPKISGRIREVLMGQGDTVKAGAPLVRLDDEELRQQVEIAKANLEVAQAAIDRLKTDEQRASASLTQAKSEWQRQQKLLSENATPQASVDKAGEALAIAEAGLSRATAAIVEGQKQQIAAEKTLQFHQAQLTDTTISAPFDGLVIRRMREAGDVAIPGGAILSLVSTEVLWISAWVDETEMTDLHVEQPAVVIFRSDPDRKFAGQVARLGREADRETREFVVDVRVLEFPDNWAVGQRADVWIETRKKSDVLAIPPEFVVWRDNVVGTYVDQAGAARWCPLKLGIRRSDLVEVVSGLASGERVISPMRRDLLLSDGVRVTTP